MACNKTDIIKDIEKRIARTLKSKDNGLSNTEIRAIAKKEAPTVFEEMQQDRMEDEADSAALINDPELVRINSAIPHVKHKSGNSYVPVKVVGKAEDGRLNYMYHKGDTVYPISSDNVKLMGSNFDTAASLLVDMLPKHKPSRTVAANATRETDGGTIVLSNAVLEAREIYTNNPTIANANKLSSVETAVGLRNAFGETIAEGKTQRVIKSSNDEGTVDEINSRYFSEGGDLSTSTAINESLRNFDKDKYGDNFDADHSKELDETLATIVDAVKALDTANVTITEAQMSSRAAKGSYSPFSNSINIHVDPNHNGEFFRQRFTQTAQEVYVHEMVHAALEFLFSNDRNIQRDPTLAALVSTTKELYNTARNGLKGYEGLLPGYSEGTTTYTEFEIAQAKEKYEYIFNNANGVGFEEFAAHILTNKQFKLAMSNIDAITKQEKKESEGLIDKLINSFKDMVSKIVGLAVHKKDSSITDAGADLLFKIMKAHTDNGGAAAAHHPLAVATKTTEYLDNVLNKVDEKMVQPVDVFTSKVLLEGVKSEVEKYAKIKEDVKRVLNGEVNDPDEVAKIQTANRKLNKEKAELFSAIGKLLEGVKGHSIDTRDMKMPIKLLALGKNGLSLLKDLYVYGRILTKLRKLKEIDPVAYAQRMSKLNGFINRIEKMALVKILKDFSTKDLTYNRMTDAILKLTAAVDSVREGNYEQVLSSSKDWFGRVNINGNALKKQNEALTSVVLRTDIQSLDIDAKGLLELLDNPSQVTSRINELSKRIGNAGMIEDANLAASYMVTGTGLITNATNISKGFGRASVESSPETVAAIEELITLKALSLTPTSEKAVLADFISGRDFKVMAEGRLSKVGKKLKIYTGKGVLEEEEYKSSIEEGVNSFLQHAEGTAKLSREEMVAEPHNLVKGYMKETFDTGSELITMPLKDKDELERDGFKFVRVVKSNRVGSEQHAIYTRKDGATKRVSGALGLQGTKSRGVSLSAMIHSEVEEMPNGEKIDYNAESARFKTELAAMVTEYNKDRTGSTMQPVYNDAGKITDFRTTMSHQEKKVLLDMETRGTQNLSRTYSTFGTAEETLKHNKKVLRNIKNDADKNYKLNPNEYVVIKPRAANSAEDFGLDMLPKDSSEEEQLWARLPDSTKEEAAKLYDGEKKIVIRRDLVLPAFGENDLTITTTKLGRFFGKEGRRNLKQIENYWMDLMQIAKGNIVIKVPDVLIGNVVSNAKILFYSGVNPVKGTKMLLLGARELKRFESENKELQELKRVEGLRRSGKSSAARIRELELSIEGNMVYPLYKAGMYQSIVEDVSTRKETNRVSEKANKVVDKYVTNETANTAIQYLFLTERTKPFQAMLKATQVSDFYFRFAQYYDTIDKIEALADSAIAGSTKAEKSLRDKLEGYLSETTPLKTRNGNVSEELMTAIREHSMRIITDNYINYEAPLNDKVRYWDKVNPGFVRYYTNIQRVIKRIAKANPGRVTADFALQMVVGDTDGIEDQTFMEKGIKPYLLHTYGMVTQAISPAGPELAMAYAR